MNQPLHAITQLHEDPERGKPCYPTLGDIARSEPSQLAAAGADCLPIVVGSATA